MAVTLGLSLDFLSGLLFVALGVAVARVHPSRPASRAFAAFAVFFGLDFVLSNTASMLGLPETFRFAPAVLDIPAGVALVLMSLRLRPLPRRALRLRLALALLAGIAAPLVWFPSTAAQLPTDPLSVSGIVGRLFLIGGAFPAASLVAAEGYARARDDAGRTQMAILGTALALYPMLQWGMQFPMFEGAASVATALLTVGLAGVWLALSLRAPGAAFAARVSALAHTGAACLGVIATAAYGDFFAAIDSGVNGLARTAAVVAIAYAILRHQLFDIDVKVKWTLRRGTVAASVVGLFFVVSESAAAFLSEQMGTYLGIAAAGVLLFALAPLQRLADRLADAAMPHVHEADEEYLLQKKRQAYRDALEVAWADGALDAAEARRLRQLREALQLSAEECERLEGDWIERDAPAA